MTQFGMYSQTTPRNDASPARGQWDLADAYRYISEAYGGYHFDVMNGINVEAGIFMSYVGLWSYYNFDNWTYQPSYVSSNTPWFFNGMRIQIFPSDKLKIEPWLINGWQSYGKFNEAPGVGVQILWRPTGVGVDPVQQLLRHRHARQPGPQAHPHRRQHPGEVLRQAGRGAQQGRVLAHVDAGCEYGGGVELRQAAAADAPAQTSSASWSTTALWFDKDLFALTVGGGAINNPGRYLVLMPPINGATAFSGTPYFTANPGRPVQGAGTCRRRSTTCRASSSRSGSRIHPRARPRAVPLGAGGMTPPAATPGRRDRGCELGARSPQVREPRHPCRAREALARRVSDRPASISARPAPESGGPDTVEAPEGEMPCSTCSTWRLESSDSSPSGPSPSSATGC